MKKILAIIGSPRKGETYKAVQTFEKELKSKEEVDFEYIFLSDLNLGTCRGCCLCFTKGEQFCPLKDDRDLLLEKMNSADGVIFATPNYALQVTAIMKNFFDRFAFVFHRPRFFYKTATAIVIQGIYGGEDIVKYISNVSEFWGFKVSKGVLLTPPLGERLPSEQKKLDNKISAAARDFYRVLTGPKSYRPALKRLAIFHAARTAHEIMSDRSGADYNYFKDHGWFESDFYCETGLNPAQKAVCSLVDYVIAGQMRKTKREQEAFKANSRPEQEKGG